MPTPTTDTSGAIRTCKEAHFATFPKKLIEPCILAGCPKGGTVLDPFLGSGTTAIVAEEHGRNAIGIEGTYLKVGDNFLQVKYFENDDENIFCSEECLLRSLSVLTVFEDGSCLPMYLPM